MRDEGDVESAFVGQMERVEEDTCSIVGRSGREGGEVRVGSECGAGKKRIYRIVLIHEGTLDLVGGDKVRG